MRVGQSLHYCNRQVAEVSNDNSVGFDHNTDSVDNNDVGNVNAGGILTAARSRIVTAGCAVAGGSGGMMGLFFGQQSGGTEATSSMYLPPISSDQQVLPMSIATQEPTVRVCHTSTVLDMPCFESQVKHGLNMLADMLSTWLLPGGASCYK